MITNEDIQIVGKQTILSQSNSIARLLDFIDATFAETTTIILNGTGRLIVSGIGKSAIIAQKLVATFNSTGTPSIFLHAAEAIHGDLGIIQPNDIVLCISKSGNSPEIKTLIPLIKRFGNTLIGMTGNTTSFLAKESNYILNTTVEAECCPLNLAPTNSTTAQLVMGDALAICLMHLRNFTHDDFAKYHPGGSLGKKLLLKAKDLLENSLQPIVSPDTPLKKVIIEISEKRLGATAVVENEKVIGMITDGDIRRMLNTHDTFTHLTAKDIMTKTPKMIQSSTMVVEALNILEDFSITQLIVLENEQYIGIIHLHDILKEGII